MNPAPLEFQMRHYFVGNHDFGRSIVHLLAFFNLNSFFTSFLTNENLNNENWMLCDCLPNNKFYHTLNRRCSDSSN